MHHFMQCSLEAKILKFSLSSLLQHGMKAILIRVSPKVNPSLFFVGRLIRIEICKMSQQFIYIGVHADMYYVGSSQSKHEIVKKV